MRLAEAEWTGLMERSGTRNMLREDGSLELYESEAEFEASLPGWAARDRFGIAFRHVEGDDLAALQPGLSPRFVKGTFVPGWKTVADPSCSARRSGLMRESKGARFEQVRVEHVEAMENGARCSWPTARRDRQNSWSLPPVHGRISWQEILAIASR